MDDLEKSVVEIKTRQEYEMKRLDGFSAVLDKVCSTTETVMGIQKVHSEQIGLLLKCLYGAMALVVLSVGGALVGLVVKPTGNLPPPASVAAEAVLK